MPGASKLVPGTWRLAPGAWCLVVVAILLAGGCVGMEDLLHTSEARELLDEESYRTQNFKIAVAPIPPWPPASGEGSICFRSSAAEIRELAIACLDGLRVFSSVVAVDPPAELTEPEDRRRAALDLAREVHADFLMELRVTDLELGESSLTGLSYLNCLVWFFTGPLSFLVPDRNYASRLRVEMRMSYVGAGPEQALAREIQRIIQTGGTPTSLIQRSRSYILPYLLSILLPPPFNGGTDEAVSETLTIAMVHDALLQLAWELKKDFEEVAPPSDVRFELVQPARTGLPLGDSFEILLVSGTERLWEVEIRVEGAESLVLRGSDLDQCLDQGPGGEDYRYRITLPCEGIENGGPIEVQILILTEGLLEPDSRTYRFGPRGRGS